MTHSNHLIEEILVKELLIKVWADLKQTNMRWAGNTQQSLLPKSLKGPGEREGARTERAVAVTAAKVVGESCPTRAVALGRSVQSPWSTARQGESRKTMTSTSLSSQPVMPFEVIPLAKLSEMSEGQGFF